MEPTERLVQLRLASGSTTERQGQGRKRKRQERQEQRKRWQRSLGKLGRREAERRRASRREERFGQVTDPRAVAGPTLRESRKANVQCQGVPDDVEIQEPSRKARRWGGATHCNRVDAGAKSPCNLPPDRREPALEEVGNPMEASPLTEAHSTVSGGAGRYLPCYPRSRESWLAELEKCSTMTSMGTMLAWGLINGFAKELSSSAEPLRPPKRKPRTGELFPLPVMPPRMEEFLDNDAPADKLLSLAVRSWVAVCCAATNVLYGCTTQGFSRQPGKVHTAALEDMADKIGRFLTGDSTPEVGFDEVIKDLKNKKVSYSGEEISQPFPLSCSQIIKGLPPVGHGGSIQVLPFLQGRTKFLMENPLESLLPPSERGGSPVTAKVHIKRGEEQAVFDLLCERGVICWVPEETAFSDVRGTYLSGLFGVTKPNKYTDDGQPILRVITNLIPANGLFSMLRGDIDYLPNATGWVPMAVSEGEQVVMNQSDMASAFYLFAVPHAWYPFFCLNYRTPGVRIGKDPKRFFRPAIRVLPLGWSSSVGVMQQVSREILLSQGMPRHLEFKKSGRVPPWFTQVIEASSPSRAWWQIYLDNFFSGERDPTGHGDLGFELQQIAMRAWDRVGVLSAADKQVLRSKVGVRLDGVKGLLGASPARTLRTIWASIYLFQRGVWSKREAQVVLGRWVFLLQFRRAAMGSLSNCWRAIERKWPSKLDIETLYRELWVLCGLAPLLQTDLEAKYDGMVTVSDASETGGAAAVSTGLSWSGQSCEPCGCQVGAAGPANSDSFMF